MVLYLRNLRRLIGFSISIWNYEWPRGFSILIWMEGNQEVSLSWEPKAIACKRSKFEIRFWMIGALLFHYFGMCDFSLFFLDLNFLFRKENHWFFIVLWKKNLLSLILLLLLFCFEIWNLKFSLKSDTLCSWSSLKIYFSLFKIENFFKLIPSVFKIFEKPSFSLPFFSHFRKKEEREKKKKKTNKQTKTKKIFFCELT